MVAAKVGLFEALASSALKAADVAARCGTEERATAKLLSVLEATGYVKTSAGRALANLYFALTSASGTLSVGDLAAWEREEPQAEAAGAVRDAPGSRPAERGEARIADLKNEIVMVAPAAALRDAFT
jgi:hypothetical protein